MNNKLKLVTGVFLLLFFVLSFQMASSLAQDSAKENATLCMNSSSKIIENMKNEGFNTERVEDIFEELETVYDAQVILERDNRKNNFSKVIPYCEQIEKIKNKAFDVLFSFQALKEFYSNEDMEGMNTSSINSIINEIQSEIESERYEKVPPLIDAAYLEIGNVKAEYTTLNLIYKTTARGLKHFFMKNGVTLLILFVILLLLYLFYRKTISKWLIKRKIEDLELKRSTLKKLIQKTQKKYFEKGDMSETEYQIRTKNFAELIRDINRQIPLLKESLARLNYKKEGKKKENQKSARKKIKKNTSQKNKKRKSLKKANRK
ncbi:hypothetical protein B6U91_02350 [Candidatus Pacearchaeota archaeon ex4484_71]|nr:MAG: hypothetical protein B6U91_02350 [Candidatus Pacearchaeota archaeon ex4484_71]